MQKEFFDNNKYLICAGLSTLSLVVTSISNISVSKSKASKFIIKKNRFNYLHLQLKNISNKSLIYI